MIERTLAIIKPDAVIADHTAEILRIIEAHGFAVVAKEERSVSVQEAQEFYAEHKERPFFGELVAYMTSGPVVLLVLEAENAVLAWRDLMGATDPVKAAEGTIRKLFGTNIGSNATHGSDSAQSAQRELNFFFPHLS